MSQINTINTEKQNIQNKSQINYHDFDQDHYIPKIFNQPKFIKILYNHHKFIRRQKKESAHNKHNSMIYKLTKGIFSKDILFQCSSISYEQSSFIHLPNGIKIKGITNEYGFNGPVEIKFENGLYFKGEYKNGIRIYGYAKLNNGFQYQGGFFNDEFQGFGSLTFANGKKVSGYWKNGQIQQNGRIDYPTGQIYYGELLNLKKHGFGYIFFTDNSKYTGKFQKGKIKGQGIYYTNDNQIFQGIWKDGILVSQMQSSINIQFDQSSIQD